MRAVGSHLDYKGKRILDVGCARGYLANHLARMGARSVTGIGLEDLNVQMAIAVAEKKDIKNVRFFQGDFHKWETSDRFDYVMSYEALEHIPRVVGTLERMAALLGLGVAPFPLTVFS